MLSKCTKCNSLPGHPAGDTFYVIEEGTFTVFDDTLGELARISKGSCFGELALLRQDARAASVRALTDALVLACHRDDFIQKLGSLAVIRHMWRFEALRKVGVVGRMGTVPAAAFLVPGKLRGTAGVCLTAGVTCSAAAAVAQQLTKPAAGCRFPCWPH